MSIVEEIDDAYKQLQALRYLLDRAADYIEASDRKYREGQAAAWWEGVNDQWKHLPQGARLIEFANPYRDPKKLSDWVQPQRSDDE